MWQRRMYESVVDIASVISRNAHQSPMYLVGIDGLGGSGKTVLTQKVCQLLEASELSVMTVHNDDFYLPSTSRSQLAAHLKPIGSDFDWMRLRDQVLMPLRVKQVAHYARYDWLLDRLAEYHEIQPHGVVLVEGVLFDPCRTS